jgi:hypothetical protein
MNIDTTVLDVNYRVVYVQCVVRNSSKLRMNSNSNVLSINYKLVFIQHVVIDSSVLTCSALASAAVAACTL